MKYGFVILIGLLGIMFFSGKSLDEQFESLEKTSPLNPRSRKQFLKNKEKTIIEKVIYKEDETTRKIASVESDEAIPSDESEFVDEKEKIGKLLQKQESKEKTKEEEKATESEQASVKVQENEGKRTGLQIPYEKEKSQNKRTSNIITQTGSMQFGNVNEPDFSRSLEAWVRDGVVEEGKTSFLENADIKIPEMVKLNRGKVSEDLFVLLYFEDLGLTCYYYKRIVEENKVEDNNFKFDGCSIPEYNTEESVTISGNVFLGIEGTVKDLNISTSLQILNK